MDAVNDLTAFIASDGFELVTDSRAVALAFKKRHENVLRTVEKMRTSKHPEISTSAELNFEPSTYKDSTGLRLPMFKITAKGFSELAMSFSGDNARIIRIRFLNAFDEVAERLARAERSIADRLLELERREMPSVVRGQVGSRLMNQRRREKPIFEEERAILMAISQPGLPLFR